MQKNMRCQRGKIGIELEVKKRQRSFAYEKERKSAEQKKQKQFLKQFKEELLVVPVCPAYYYLVYSFSLYTNGWCCDCF